MEGRRTRFSDGTTWENCNAGYADGFLWLYTDGVTLMEALPVVTDAEATETIVYEYGNMSDTYEGFTHLKMIQDRPEGCSVCLEREVPE